MILVEFLPNIHDTENVLRYRDIDEPGNWHYIRIDSYTLFVLIQRYGVISTRKMTDTYSNLDNPTTGTIINATYHGAGIQLYCCAKNKTFYLPHLGSKD
jgi:hypothetical protein